MTPNQKLCVAFQEMETSDARAIARLETAIIRAVEHHRKRTARQRTLGYGGLLAVSIMGMVPAVWGLAAQLSQSGFFRYLSLAFSDGGAMWSMGKDFGLLLGESLPVMSVILVGAILIITLWSLKKLLSRSLAESVGGRALNRTPSYESIA